MCERLNQVSLFKLMLRVTIYSVAPLGDKIEWLRIYRQTPTSKTAHYPV